VVDVERAVADTLERWRLSLVGDVAGAWPKIIVVDRRQSDPHDGVLARESSTPRTAHSRVAIRSRRRVLQRLGDGRLFACAKCGELARCGQCGQAEEEVDDRLVCRERHEPRANFCRACGATNLKRLRTGVTTLARDVAAQLGQEVSEVTATNDLVGRWSASSWEPRPCGNAFVTAASSSSSTSISIVGATLVGASWRHHRRREGRSTGRTATRGWW